MTTIDDRKALRRYLCGTQGPDDLREAHAALNRLGTAVEAIPDMLTALEGVVAFGALLKTLDASLVPGWLKVYATIKKAKG